MDFTCERSAGRGTGGAYACEWRGRLSFAGSMLIPLLGLRSVGIHDMYSLLSRRSMYRLYSTPWSRNYLTVSSPALP